MEIGSVMFPPNMAGSFWRGGLFFSFLQLVGFFCWMYIGSQLKQLLRISSVGGWLLFGLAVMYGVVPLVLTGLSDYAYDWFFFATFVLTFAGGVWFSFLASDAFAGRLGKLRITRDSASLLRLTARRGGFVFFRMALMMASCWLLGLLGPVTGMVYEEMSDGETIAYVAGVLGFAVALGFLLGWVFKPHRVIACDVAARHVALAETGQPPRTVRCADIAKVTLDRREGEDDVFVVAVDLVLTDGEIIPIDSGTNGPYLAKIAQRLSAAGRLAFDDLQDGLDDHA